MQLRTNERFLSGCLFTIFLAFASLQADAQELSWISDSKVEVGSNNPQVSGGPTAASGGSEFLSVYVGASNSKLWYSFMNTNLSWQGNKPIQDSHGNNVTSSGGRPAVSYVDGYGYFLLVVPGASQFQTFKFSPDSWAPVDTHTDITEREFSEPTLGDGGDYTHLLICDNNGNLLWYKRANTIEGVGAWTNETRVASGKYPSATSVGDVVHALYWDTDQRAFFKLTLPHGAANWQSNRIILTGPTPNQGAAIAAVNGQLFVIYTINGSDNMQFSALTSDFKLTPPLPIKPNGQSAATNKPSAAAWFQNAPAGAQHGSLVLTHEGESSNNLWFSVGVPTQ